MEAGDEEATDTGAPKKETVKLETSAKGKRRPGAKKSFWRSVADAYGAADPRSLGLLRILLGTLLFWDVARRLPDLESFFTNSGWLSNHFALFRPMSSHLFSIYHAFSTPGEVRVLFGLHLLVNLLFVIGYKTRLMHILAAVLITSLNSRNIMTENGGYVMLNLLVIWTLVLPMGRRFSVDSLLGSLRAVRETSLKALNDRQILGVRTDTVYSLAVTAVILQWVVNYYFNTVHKAGGPWHEGTAIHYFMGQGRLLRPFGIWLREVLPLEVTSLLTTSTLVMEGSIVLLLLSPFFSGAARMVAWVIAIALHLGIASFARLGPFSFVMMTAFAGMVPAGAWRGVRQRMRSKRQGVEVVVDEKNGFSVATARLLKRFDLLHKLEFVPRSEADKKAGLVVKPLTMKGEQPGGASRGIEAWRLVLDNLPVPRPLVALGWVTGLFKLPGALLHRLLRRRGHYSRFFGFDQPSRQRETGTTGVRRSVDRMGFWAGQVLVFLLMLACGSQVLIENRAVPPWLKPESRPEWMTAAVTYPRLFQGWSMFAPEPPRDDGWIIVDGRTKDGRKLDPLTGKEPNFSMDLPGGPDFSAQWSAFNMRIHEQRFRPYLNGLRDYLKNLHEINGRPDDELVAFDVWYVSRITLPPGQGFTPPTYRKLTAFGHVKDSLVPQDKIQSKTPGRGAGTPARANQPKRRPAGARPISPARPRPSRAPKNEKQLTAPGPLRELR